MARQETTEDYRRRAWNSLEKARQYLAEGDLHQASERGWGAAAHMGKAVASARGWDYDTHAYFNNVVYQAREMADNPRISLLRGIPNDLHGNYYRRKRRLNPQAIKEDLDAVAELLDLLAPLDQPLSR